MNSQHIPFEAGLLLSLDVLPTFHYIPADSAESDASCLTLLLDIRGAAAVLNPLWLKVKLLKCSNDRTVSDDERGNS